MKRLKHTLLLACTILIMVGCLDNTGSEPTVITDPSVTTHLSIANQSSIDLNLTYKTTNEYGALDSTVAVPAGSTTLIFEPGGFSFPTPSEALAKLSFYNASGDTASPTLVIEPVVDENWNDVTTEVDNVTKFELVITEEDIK